MATLVHNLSEVFAVSIIHSLWQVLLIYLVVRLLLADLIKFSAAVKHHISLGAMFTACLWFIYTLFDEASAYSWHFTAHAPTVAQHLPLIEVLKKAAATDDSRYEVILDRYLPYISIAYVTGLLFQSLKLIFAWLQIRQVKRTSRQDTFWQERIQQLSALLNIKKLVAISITDKIDVPCIIGYLKPVILIPISLTTYLSVKEVEAILLHELAHVKRNDYLINLLQQVVMVILFFNPFIYLINRLINREREHSCDDMVVNQSAPLIYAQALLKIEQNNHQQWQLALAADGKNKFHLFNRIERIMKTKRPTPNVKHIVMALSILTITAISVSWFSPAIGNGRFSVKKLKPVIENLLADTTKPTAKAPKSSTKSKSVAASREGKHIITGGHSYYYTDGYNDPKLEAWGKQMEKYGKEMEQYYNSASFKEMSKQMEKMGKDMENYYNNPDIKRLTDEQAALGAEIGKAYGENSDISKYGEKLGEMGSKIGAYFDSEEFKTMNSRLRKKYGISEFHNGAEKNDANFQKYQDELKSHIPAEINATTDEMKKLGDQMRQRTESPELKAKTERMRTLGDSMRKLYNNDQMKAKEVYMRKLGEQMRLYADNKQMKQLKEQMKQLGEQMRTYTQSPEFKRKLEQWHKEHPEAEWDERPELPEVPEKPEQPEKPEVSIPTPPGPPAQ
ncbi:M48 family metalloprotease [Mucilaginibacter sp. RS28]|uniref:M48 family metalloprotease n=1 Tax=Mucilaginibacter straminoryzae TaxID=2932774 RepID=A0A9X1X490_9SPHI|nr:M56 family metallopeptidase [Mucilaginibacter straminoryzae]MCJ8210668.1 M48 family metalloprotease [Mucilaginibacter straminoryzae]